MTPREQFASNLKWHRQKHLMSQGELGKMLNVDRSTVTYWENAKSEPSLTTLNKLCKIFDIDYNTLLGKKKKNR